MYRVFFKANIEIGNVFFLSLKINIKALLLLLLLYYEGCFYAIICLTDDILIGIFDEDIFLFLRHCRKRQFYLVFIGQARGFP